MVEQLGIKGTSRAVTAPGTEEQKEEDKEEDHPLEEQKKTEYRGIAARMNYLSQDRPDIMFAVKELTRHMAQPTVASRSLLKRLGRYLLGFPRVALQFDYQSVYKHVGLWTDSDWAGDRKSGKSASGGLLCGMDMYSRHGPPHSRPLPSVRVKPNYTP